MRVEPPLVWDYAIVDKLLQKHEVEPGEVEEIFFDDRPHSTRFQNVYHAYGRTISGRYLFVVFRYLEDGNAKPITAYEMTDTQRRYYQRIMGGT